MLSQKQQLYLAIVVLIIVGVFFFPDVYRDTKSEHEFCCSSFSSKVANIQLDSNDNWVLTLSNSTSYTFDKFLTNEDVEEISIGDSIVKKGGSVKMMLYGKNNFVKEINKENATVCECD